MVRIKGTEKAEGYSVKTIFINPGAIAAGADIALPTWAVNPEAILQAILIRTNSVTWAGLGATGATVATRDVAAAASGTDGMTEFITLAIVTAAPTGNQIQLFDANNVRVGVATIAGDGLLIVLKYKSFEIQV